MHYASFDAFNSNRRTQQREGMSEGAASLALMPPPIKPRAHKVVLMIFVCVSSYHHSTLSLKYGTAETSRIV